MSTSVRLKYLAESPKVLKDSGTGSVPHYSIPNLDAHGRALEEPWASIGSAKQTVTNGDVLLSKLNPHKPRIVEVAHHSAVASMEFVVLRRPSIDKRYLRYFLAALTTQQDLVSRMKSVTRSHQRASTDDVLNLLVPSVAKEHGPLIAEFLDRETERIDAVVAAKRRMIELLDEERTALSGVRLFPGGPGELNYEDWFLSLPADWSVRSLRSLVDEVRDCSVDGIGELLSVSHLRGVGRRANSPEVTMTMADSLIGYKHVRRDDLVVNTLWAWMGGAGVAMEPGLVSPAYHVYRPRVDILPAYLDLLVRCGPFVAQMRAHSEGVWSSRLRLYPHRLMSLRVPLPPLDRQVQIVEEVQRHRGVSAGLSALLTTQLTLLAEYRQALVTAAVTGRLSESVLRGEFPIEEAVEVPA